MYKIEEKGQTCRLQNNTDETKTHGLQLKAKYQ